MAESLQAAAMPPTMAETPLYSETAPGGFQWFFDLVIITGVLAVAYFATTQIIEWREENKRIKSSLTD